jgi:bacillithiol biosynthesis deacetylase BshB1
MPTPPNTETWDVLAIGAHPDDVELGCGGTLALLAASRRRVGILHLTRGERGTRGTVAERFREAARAGRALGAAGVEFLDCGDGALRTGEAEEDALIEVLRRRRPEVVLAPHGPDRHPDHGRAAALVEAACFYAGLARRSVGADRDAPHRPAALFSYLQHDLFTPAFVVDVTRTWAAKKRALAAYQSQLHQPQGTGARRTRLEPQTKISSPEFAAAVEGRARHYGLLIGVEFGEPFAARGPLAVNDPWMLRPRGLR